MGEKRSNDNAIATAALLGGDPFYYDYGHPERASARQYWTVSTGPVTIYGYTRADCARKWLRWYHPEAAGV